MSRWLLGEPSRRAGQAQPEESAYATTARRGAGRDFTTGATVKRSRCPSRAHARRSALSECPSPEPLLLTAC
jgi:hypothetical protein